ncbi:hypothetical protein HRbin19_00053 [bacterium HR19]|nr:hypothetical protein HRbin19_00053 [bacterium HR19]
MLSDLLEFALSLAIFSISLTTLLISGNLNLQKQRKIQEILGKSGEKIEVILKGSCYLPEYREITTSKGSKFLCGNGEVKEKR